MQASQQNRQHLAAHPPRPQPLPAPPGAAVRERALRFAAGVPKPLSFKSREAGPLAGAATAAAQASDAAQQAAGQDAVSVPERAEQQVLVEERCDAARAGTAAQQSACRVDGDGLDQAAEQLQGLRLDAAGAAPGVAVGESGHTASDGPAGADGPVVEPPVGC